MFIIHSTSFPGDLEDHTPLWRTHFHFRQFCVNKCPDRYENCSQLPWVAHMWSASRRHVMLCYKSDPKHYTIRTPTARWWFRARQLCCRGPSTPPTTNFYKKPSSKKSISGFTRSILLRKYFYHENWDQWGAAADAHLYWDPYCNGLWEMSCLFWQFFEFVGLEKRSHTLPTLTSIKLYISNIKYIL